MLLGLGGAQILDRRTQVALGDDRHPLAGAGARVQRVVDLREFLRVEAGQLRQRGRAGREAFRQERHGADGSQGRP